MLLLRNLFMGKKQLIIFNSFDFGSTGTLCNYLKCSNQRDFFNPIFICSNKQKNGNADYYLCDHCSKIYRKIQSLKAKYFNLYGFVGKKITSKALKFVENNIYKNSEVIISIHQIESSFFDLQSLLEFAQKINSSVYITLHDCWFFTGKCAYFDVSKCEKWKRCCDVCPHKNDFPATKFKKIKKSYRKKIDLILKYKEIITFICPSQWIASKLQESPLRSVDYKVIHNGIDISFSTIKTNSDKKIGLIAAASPWTERKGLKFLKYLSNNIDYKKFSLTVIGADDYQGFSNKAVLCKTISREKLMVEFSKNDYFLNPTLEDNFPTTNIEALSCGLKIVSFATGGSCESFDEKTGICIQNKTNEELLKTILGLKKNNDKEACINRAKMYFSKDIFVSKYYNLFRNEKV